jgi:glycosyltransferase involved in cell wall biosynthesis
MSPIINKTLFTNKRDANNVTNGGYLEIGYDPEIYCPEGDIVPCKPIAFMGNNYGPYQFPLSGLRLEMNELLKRTFSNIYGVYGTNWPRADGSFNHCQYEEAKAYRSAKIGINLSHFDEDSYSSDRMLRILGTGTFCLAKRYRGMPYTDGEHLVCWDTLPELVDKINYYLEHEDEREAIAKAGNEFVKQNFTFDKMVKNLIEIYEQR